ncbi:hypothetical protein [Aestuariivita sp.]|jgi:hypothetical protein|uniref:hypothetical protein n=1 Tax=Aestuariivita sp. TaxID=1872407 RepID=UPI00216F01BD|nr:hypothetical protein [Aestuariivita sp.]MCE8005436.1 hypothetical protein [Aestuariivita sp.]
MQLRRIEPRTETRNPQSNLPVALTMAERDLLNHLRMTALRCRSAARADLFEACALLSTDRNRARNAHADALMRCIGSALNTRPIFFRPGEAEISFDERWLVSLARAHATKDEASFTFLMASRVDKWAIRNLGFLIRRITDTFSLD